MRDTCPAYLPPSSTHISPLLISRQCGGALSTSRSATLSPNVRHDWHHWLSSLLSRRLRARASFASLLSLVGRLFGERTRVSKSRAFAWPSVSHGLVLNLSSASGIRREGDAPLSVVLVLLVLRPPRWEQEIALFGTCIATRSHADAPASQLTTSPSLSLSWPRPISSTSEPSQTALTLGLQAHTGS